jgi:ParB family transcriptional regulator, chromosome partitioning protein
MVEKRPALGKGLSALIPDAPEPRSSTLEVDVDRLAPNPFQPRKAFDAGGIEELASSIREHGVIQPILVRKDGANFQIIAGERRWRAAQRAGLLKVPVVVKDLGPGQDVRALEWALIENLQREDLNPIEEALGYRRLADDFAMTQEQIAAAMGKDRSSVANTLRLLKLPPPVRELVAGGALSMGHARALLALESDESIVKASRDIVSRGLSVRETESLMKRLSSPPRVKPPAKIDVHTREAEQQLHLSLGTPVRIVRSTKGGRIEIEFKNENELQRLYETLTGESRG